MPKTITAADVLARFGVSTTAGCFDLTAVRGVVNGVISNILTWKWPANLKEGLMAGGPSFLHFTVQRSTNASNSPTADVAYIVSGTVPVFDPNWTDIKQWTQGIWNADGNPSTWTDPWDSQLPVCYRVILNCNTPPRVEMDWIPVLVVPTQNFWADHRCAQSGQIQPRLCWEAPDVSWFPTPGTACP